MLSARRSLVSIVAVFAGIVAGTSLLTGKLVVAQQRSLRTAAAEKKAASLNPGDIDLKRSRVYVKVDKTGLGHTHGVEGQFKSGHVDIGSADKAGSMVFDMTTFVADTAAARRYVGLSGTTDASTARQVTANMTGADVLDVRRYPTATFEIDSVAKAKQQAAKDGTQYVLDGKFTLHGVTHPLRILATATPQKDGSTRLRGGFYINQTSFGITPYSKAFGAVGVADRLTIWGDVFLAGAPKTAARSR